MTDDQGLQIILDAAGVSGETLDSESLGRVWALMGVADEDLEEEFRYAVASIPGQDAGGTSAEALAFRIGRWSLDLRQQVTRAALLATIVAAALATQGVGAIGIGLATVVVPSVLLLENVTLSPGDQRLLFELRRDPRVAQEHLNLDQLYASLPQATREVVNPYDFADFVDRLRKAGVADEHGAATRVRRAGETRPLIDWR